MVSFSAQCSAVPQVPASASRRASTLGWWPLPNARLGRTLCRNRRLGCACPAELDDANTRNYESRLTGSSLESCSEQNPYRRAHMCICDCSSDDDDHPIRDLSRRVVVCPQPRLVRRAGLGHQLVAFQEIHQYQLYSTVPPCRESDSRTGHALPTTRNRHDIAIYHVSRATDTLHDAAEPRISTSQNLVYKCHKCSLQLRLQTPFRGHTMWPPIITDGLRLHSRRPPKIGTTCPFRSDLTHATSAS